MSRPSGARPDPGATSRSACRRAAAAIAALLLVGSGCTGGSATPSGPPASGAATTDVNTTATSSSTSSSATTAGTTSTSTSTSTFPSTSTSAPPTTTTPLTTVPPPELLRRGDEGAAVRELQARLSAIGYWLGDVDGTYNMLTEQAVYAFQKAQGLAVDGVVGPEVRSALLDPKPIVPTLAEPSYLEVDLGRQIIVFVRDGRPIVVLNTSTGSNERYQHPTQGTQLADTPVGRFSVTWQVDGISEGELGPLYRPKFFHPDGIAVHGYDSVPSEPVSHGCVRVTPAAMDLIWAQDFMPVGSTVHVYGSPPTS